METLEYRVRHEGIAASAVAKNEGWTLLAWCLFHMRRAWRLWCSAAKTFTPPHGIPRSDALKIIVALLDGIRLAKTHPEQHAAIELAERLLSGGSLADIDGLRGIALGLSINGEARVQLHLPGVELVIDTGPYDTKNANPLQMSDAAAYIAKWTKWKVLWTDLYVGERLRRCSITAEIGNNQIKHFEYEQLPMRIDRFLVHDATVHGGVVARFEHELRKLNAAGGQSLGRAARASAVSAAPTATTADAGCLLLRSSSLVAHAPAASAATAAATADGQGEGEVDGGEVDGEDEGEGEDEVGDAQRAVDAPPDHWQRGGVPLATQNAIAEVNAAKTARPMSQARVATRLLDFAFGGGPGQPRLAERERAHFPASQASMSSFLRGERKVSAAAAKTIEEWARQVRTGELVYRD